MGRKKKSYAIDVSKITRETQVAVIEDLLRKYPRGPKGTLTKDDYVGSWNTDPVTKEEDGFLREWDSKDLNRTICGYKFVDLYHLFTAKGKAPYFENLVEAVDERDFIPQRALTRRSRRLEHRIGTAIRRVNSVGIKGVYSVQPRYGYNIPNFYVYANNVEDASIQAAMMLNPVADLLCDRRSSGLNYTDPNSWTARFHEAVEPAALMAMNLEVISVLKKKKQGYQEKIDMAKKTMSQLDDASEFLHIYSTNCVGANS